MFSPDGKQLYGFRIGMLKHRASNVSVAGLGSVSELPRKGILAFHIRALS